MAHALIPPDVLSRLKNLRLAAARSTGAGGIGQHASHTRGAGLEFVQYRGYEPGDALRQVDWKLYARSDRFFVREAERESPLTLWLLVDGSASMAQSDRARPEWSRLDGARLIAACIAEIALRQGDRVGLVGLHATGLRMLPPRAGTRAHNGLWLALQALECGGHFPARARLAPLWECTRAGDLVILIGDLFDEAAVALAERLAAAGREVRTIQLLTAEERDFPFDGSFLFHDAETGAEIQGDARAMHDGYLERFSAALRALDARLDAAGIARARGALDEPPDRVLHRILAPGAPA